MIRFCKILSLIVMVTFIVTGCSETEEFNEFNDWKNRNDLYIGSLADSISDKNLKPDEAEDGKMFRILSYKIKDTLQISDDKYVYCTRIKKGDGDTMPNYTDSIRMNYRVRLIPSENYPNGYVVEQSYKTEQLNPSINVPASFKMSNMVDGMVSALQNMRVGDIWEITIPYTLGYGGVQENSIPSYSTLIFYVNLTETAMAGTSLSVR